MTAQQTDRDRLSDHDRMNYWWRRATQAEERIAEEKRLRMKATAAATETEARIKAVQDVLDKHESIVGDDLGVPVERTRRALEG